MSSLEFFLHFIFLLLLVLFSNVWCDDDDSWCLDKIIKVGKKTPNQNQEQSNKKRQWRVLNMLNWNITNKCCCCYSHKDGGGGEYFTQFLGSRQTLHTYILVHPSLPWSSIHPFNHFYICFQILSVPSICIIVVVLPPLLLLEVFFVVIAGVLLLCLLFSLSR